VCERIGHHDALSPSLYRVIADRGRGSDGLFGITRFDQSLRLRVMGPDTGVAVGLQLKCNRQPIALTSTLHLVHCAHDVLNVMTDLMCDHVGLGKITIRSKFLFQLTEETEIEVEVLVARTIERPHRGLAVAAGGPRLPVI